MPKYVFVSYQQRGDSSMSDIPWLILGLMRFPPEINFFADTFGSYEKEHAALGIVLQAVSNGEWLVTYDAIEVLCLYEGPMAVHDFHARLVAHNARQAALRRYERLRCFSLGISTRFMDKPQVEDLVEPDLVFHLARASLAEIHQGIDELFAEGYLKMWDTATGTFEPTEKFFTVFYEKYRKAGLVR